MDILQERYNLDKRIDELLEKYGYEYSLLGGLLTPYYNEEEHKKDLQTFHFLFSQGEEARDYIWNHLWGRVHRKHKPNENEFSNEELDFLYSIYDYCEQQEQKYEGYRLNSPTEININGEIQTNRLLLRPFDIFYQEQFHQIFQKDPVLFEEYYHKKYDEQTCSEVNWQKLRP